VIEDEAYLVQVDTDRGPFYMPYDRTFKISSEPVWICRGLAPRTLIYNSPVSRIRRPQQLLVSGRGRGVLKKAGTGQRHGPTWSVPISVGATDMVRTAIRNAAIVT
jgi:hypothetical protein